MRTGQYDGVSASGNATLRLMVAGTVAPVNVNLLTNYKNINPALKDQPYNTYQGRHFGAPHGWGANLLMWRTDIVKPAPTSWGVVFDPNSPYRGKVTAYDDPIYIADGALYLKTHRPDLHITDPYELDTSQFNAAVTLLKQQRMVIGQYWSDYTKTQAAFANGDTLLGTTWQVITNLLLTDKNPTPVQAIVPSEGSTGWSDTWMVSATAAHPNCMYMWMNWIESPDVQAQVATWFGEAPANFKACDVIVRTDVHFCDTYKATDASFLRSLALWKVPLKDCGDSRGSICKGYQDWLNAWTDIKG
jgi:putative spermidine/putrescine transport system substrate-binding protein